MCSQTRRHDALEAAINTGLWRCVIYEEVYLKACQDEKYGRIGITAYFQFYNNQHMVSSKEVRWYKERYSSSAVNCDIPFYMDASLARHGSFADPSEKNSPFTRALTHTLNADVPALLKSSISDN